MKALLKNFASTLLLLTLTITVYASDFNWVSLSLVNLTTPTYLNLTYSNVELRVTNPNSHPLYLNYLASPSFPAGFTVTSNNCSDISLAANAYCSVIGNFTPTQLGTNTWSTKVAVNNLIFDKVYSTSAAVEQGPADITVDTADSDDKVLAFTGSSGTGTITLTNVGASTASDLTVTLASSIAGLSIAPGTCTNELAAGASCTYVLTYAPTSNNKLTSVDVQKATIDVNYEQAVANEQLKSETLAYTMVVNAVPDGYFVPLPSFNKPSGHIAGNIAKKINVSNDTLYLATNGGLSISTDNGTVFRNRNTTNGLGSDDVNAAAANSSRIFVATNNGLSISTDGGDTFTTKTTTNALGNNIVNDVAVVGETVYAATAGGLSVSTDNGDTFTNITSGLGSSVVNDVVVVGNTIYVATAGGVSIGDVSNLTFTNKTTGLGSTDVNGVAVVDGTIYAATAGGLSISTDAGDNFNNETKAAGLGSNDVKGVTVVGDTIYAATTGGLSIGTLANGFTNKTTTDGLADNSVNSVAVHNGILYASTENGLSISTNNGSTFHNKYGFKTYTAFGILAVAADGNNVYVGGNGGLAISTDGGQTFTTKTAANGLGSNAVMSIAVSGKNIYVGTYSQLDLEGGLSISDNSGVSCVNKTTTNGLGGNNIYAMAVNGSTIYAATFTDGVGKGLSVSTNNGVSFTKYTFGDGANNYILGLSLVNDKIYAASPNGIITGPDAQGHYASTLLTGKFLWDVKVVGSTIYALLYTNGVYYVQVSHDGGETFGDSVELPHTGPSFSHMAVSDNGRYVAITTASGMYLSTDSGVSFTLKTKTDGFSNDYSRDVFFDGNKLYVATLDGLFMTVLSA